MKDNQESTSDELLQQATRELLITPIPAGPSDESLAHVVAAMEIHSDKPHGLSGLQRSRTMKHFVKFAATAASLFIICAGLAWFMTAGSGASIALADIANVLDHIRSATFTGTTTIEGEEPIIGKNMFLEPSHCRSESSRGMVMIFDESKAISLVPEKKLAIVIDLKNAPEGGVIKNWLEEVRQLIDKAIAGSKEEVEELGRCQIDGRDTVGFRLRIENKKMTVWADPDTALPIRIESTSGIMGPKYHHVMSDFRFNVDLDRSLFHVEPPEGYLVQVMSIDGSKPRVQDFIDLLAAYCAEQKNGEFPLTLSGNEVEMGLTGRIQEEMNAKFGDWKADADSREKVMKSEEFQKYMELGRKMARGTGFLYEGLPPNADWHYAGKGVKFDTPDRPIFWYRPSGSKSYRVIYADLSVKELSAEEINGFPEAISAE